MSARLLVTTALEQTCIDDRDVVLLGEWCKLYRDRARWDAIQHKVLPFHWDVPGKRETDYEYLKDFYGRVLDDLAAALDLRHGVRGGRRYWEIVTGTWLVSYLSVLFDRWECLRLAFARHERLRTVALAEAEPLNPPSGSIEQVEQCVDDTYNHHLCLDIIRREYLGRCDIIERFDVPPAHVVDAGLPQARSNRQTLRAFLRRAVSSATRLFPDPRIAFVASYFPKRALLRLNLMLGQAPKSEAPVLEAPPAGAATAAVDSGARQWLAERIAAAPADRACGTGFESYARERVARDIPRLYLEGYATVRARARELRSERCRVIVSAGAVWHDELFKVWAAEQVTAGSKLVVCEHGGSFPARQYIFDRDENIADVFTPTFLAYHPKHVLLPPTKYVEAKPVRGGEARYLMIVAFDVPRYVIRAASQPHASQALQCMEDAVRLCAALPQEVTRCVRVKPHVASSMFGWDFRARYANRLGAQAVLPDMSLPEAFKLSRIIVCTYPQSTFAEAMLTGLPTVMFFDPTLHGLHSVADDCLESLRAANIVFFDPEAAARHIAQVWADPRAWWDSAPVRAARETFLRSSMNAQPAPLRAWSKFLTGLCA